MSYILNSYVSLGIHCVNTCGSRPSFILYGPPLVEMESHKLVNVHDISDGYASGVIYILTSISDGSVHILLFDDDGGKNNGSVATADVTLLSDTASVINVGIDDEPAANVGDGEDCCCDAEDEEEKMVSISGKANDGSATALCCSCNFSNSEETAVLTSSSSSSSCCCCWANVTIVTALRSSTIKISTAARRGRRDDIIGYC